MIPRTRLFILLLAFLNLPVCGLFAVPELKVTETKELEITAADGTSAKLPAGTIGRQINADKQIFKVSYGKDLRGRTNIIIYPDPEKPQSLELKVLDQNVKLTEDAVLTVISEGAAATTQFQSGMIGTVTVGTEQLTAGASAKLAQGSLSTVAANTPVFPPAPAAKSSVSDPVTGSDKNEAASQEIPRSGDTAVYEGPKVRAIEGDVMIAPPGQDIMNIVKTATSMPRLQESQRIKPGSTVQTGPQGKAVVSPFPGCIIAIQPNSKVVFEDVQYINADYGTDVDMEPAAYAKEGYGSKIQSTPAAAGQEDKLVFVKSRHNYKRKVQLNLIEGGVLSTIKGIPKESLDYQVKTPLAVAAARGTSFGVFGDPSKALIIVSDGVVQVITPDGTYKLSVTPGNKVLITKDGAPPMPFSASPEEVQAFLDFNESVKDMDINDILADLDLFSREPFGKDLRNAIDDFRKKFVPRLNNFFMTDIFSP
ncbi:MAG: FecR family protein [Candidatus Methylacidiphilales bacterium]|nr:FecR family protein [Candidatus Methylacidiphilales bacterium]